MGIDIYIKKAEDLKIVDVVMSEMERLFKVNPSLFSYRVEYDYVAVVEAPGGERSSEDPRSLDPEVREKYIMSKKVIIDWHYDSSKDNGSLPNDIISIRLQLTTINGRLDIRFEFHPNKYEKIGLNSRWQDIRVDVWNSDSRDRIALLNTKKKFVTLSRKVKQYLYIDVVEERRQSLLSALCECFPSAFDELLFGGSSSNEDEK